MNKHYLLLSGLLLFSSSYIMSMKEQKNMPKKMTLEKGVTDFTEGIGKFTVGLCKCITKISDCEATMVRGVDSQLQQVQKTITYVCNGPRINSTPCQISQLASSVCPAISTPVIPKDDGVVQQEPQPYTNTTPSHTSYPADSQEEPLPTSKQLSNTVPPLIVRSENDPTPGDIINAFIQTNAKPEALQAFINYCDNNKLKINCFTRAEALAFIAAQSSLHDSQPPQ